MMLSGHFSLEELTTSEVAVRAGLDNQPSSDIVQNLIRLAARLELVRQALGNLPIHITSGYRAPAVNALVGGSKNSMHCLGLAADILCPGFGPPLAVCQAIVKANIPIDQVIHEFGHWCHVGFAPQGIAPRNECLTIRSATTGYELGLRAI